MNNVVPFEQDRPRSPEEVAREAMETRRETARRGVANLAVNPDVLIGLQELQLKANRVMPPENKEPEQATNVMSMDDYRKKRAEKLTDEPVDIAEVRDYIDRLYDDTANDGSEPGFDGRIAA